MSLLERVTSEIKDLPEDKLEELLQYVRRLKGSRGTASGSETLLLSEQALSKDWLSPKENAAWRDL